jgi:hypothetical protein
MGESAGQPEKVAHRKHGAILGAIVADAASMGLHWLYDVGRIRNVGGAKPEFNDPDPASYERVTGYFAHSQKRSGDLSHYGEQLLVMLRSLLQNNGSFNHFSCGKGIFAKSKYCLVAPQNGGSCQSRQ